MYLYVSEIFPTEIRPIGMGFSLFGQFAGKKPSQCKAVVANNKRQRLLSYFKPRQWVSTTLAGSIIWLSFAGPHFSFQVS